VIHRVTTHYGVDFASYYGAPIVATASGRVIFSGWKGAYGKAVIIRHANNFQSLYGHCSRILTRVGASVEQGQVIAQVGSTGWSTGPHVHYGVEIKGAPINPLTLNNQPKEKPLQGKELEKYQKTKNKILALLNQEINGEKINLTEIYR
jgi:murein DD-endopeptidase MepM/ murein hydrolase activator NlpD